MCVKQQFISVCLFGFGSRFKLSYGDKDTTIIQAVEIFIF
jgi:hypothetical protein